MTKDTFAAQGQKYCIAAFACARTIRRNIASSIRGKQSHGGLCPIDLRCARNQLQLCKIYCFTRPFSIKFLLTEERKNKSFTFVATDVDITTAAAAAGTM